MSWMRKYYHSVCLSEQAGLFTQWARYKAPKEKFLFRFFFNFGHFTRALLVMIIITAFTIITVNCPFDYFVFFLSFSSCQHNNATFITKINLIMAQKTFIFQNISKPIVERLKYPIELGTNSFDFFSWKWNKNRKTLGYWFNYADETTSVSRKGKWRGKEPSNCIWFQSAYHHNRNRKNSLVFLRIRELTHTRINM